jgi:hypothetical protein
MTELEKIQKALKDVKDAQAAASANFDPMEGRTYIPKLSPEMKKMIYDSIKGDKEKREERRSRRILRRSKRKMGDAQDFIPNNYTFAKYGGKILKKYRR